jgi:hypothetical protein
MTCVDAVAAIPIVIVTATASAVCGRPTLVNWSTVAPTVDGGAVSMCGSLIAIDRRTMRIVVVMKPSAGRLLVVSRECS